jgi:hypothetical protein
MEACYNLLANYWLAGRREGLVMVPNKEVA